MLASVAPLVKITSSGFAPQRAAICSLALSTADFAALPKAARDGDFELVRRLLEEGTYTPHRVDQALAHALLVNDD